MKSSDRFPGRRCELLTLGYRQASDHLVVIGVLLLNADQLWIYFAEEMGTFVNPEDLEVFELLAEDLRTKAAELGARQLVEYLEDTLSNVLMISDRRPADGEPQQFVSLLNTIIGKRFPATEHVNELIASLSATE